MDRSEEFYDDTYHFNAVKQNSSNDFTIPFLGKEEEVEEVTAGCGCTNLKFKNRVITGKFQEQTRFSSIADIEHYQKTYPNKYMPFIKSITVFYKDGKPLKVINEFGNEVWNPEKEQYTLYLKGFVKLAI